MEAGLAPARHPESVPFWFDGENVAFRNLGVEKAIGTQHILTVGKRVIRVEQAFVKGQEERITRLMIMHVWLGFRCGAKLRPVFHWQSWRPRRFDSIW